MPTTGVKAGSFCWYELATNNADACKKFYGELFGWTFEDTPMPGDQGGTYTMINIKGQPLGGVFKMEGPQFEGVPPHWGSYVAVDDVDASAAQAKEWGPRSCTSLCPFPASGVCANSKAPLVNTCPCSRARIPTPPRRSSTCRCLTARYAGAKP